MFVSGQNGCEHVGCVYLCNRVAGRELRLTSTAQHRQRVLCPILLAQGKDSNSKIKKVWFL